VTCAVHCAQLAAAREDAASAGAERAALQGRVGFLEREVSIKSPHLMCLPAES
jgi:hypothetical protein